MRHGESHRAERIGWLRAAVLGANDGLISTSSLVVGVAAAESGRDPVLLAALAGLVGGALSMAAGEYVSVSSQADTERADLVRERREHATMPESRGLTPELAGQVAEQLMAGDALAAHARDELGLSEATRARPIQAALASAASFAVGAALPLFLVLFLPMAVLTPAIVGSSLVLLSILGGIAARLGGAPLIAGAARVAFWGAVAMGCTALVGRLFGAAA